MNAFLLAENSLVSYFTVNILSEMFNELIFIIQSYFTKLFNKSNMLKYC